MVGLSQYPAINPDEGFWTIGARNQVLWGDALLDGRLHPFLSPGHFVALVLWFSAFAPNLASARGLSAALGFLACAVFAITSAKRFDRQAWIPQLLFGVTACTVLLHRAALLEAHESLWMVVATALWLSERGHRRWMAGIALGFAILVKSNALYLFPAFIMTALTAQSELKLRVRDAAVFSFTAASVAFIGYAIAFALDPQAFQAAFTYELNGRHFLDSGVLFHVGRFGLHPHRLAAAVGGLVRLDPLLVLCGTLGLGLAVARWRTEDVASRFFVCWLVSGAAFHLGQIYIEVRYLATLAPALAWLGSRSCVSLRDSRLAERLAVRFMSARTMATAGVVLLVLENMARFAMGVGRQSNASYWDVVNWVNGNIAADAAVVASPVYGVSLRQRTYDPFRLMNKYNGTQETFLSVVKRFGIDTVVADGELIAYSTPEMLAVLREKGTERYSKAGTTVYSLDLRPRADTRQGTSPPSDYELRAAGERREGGAGGSDLRHHDTGLARAVRLDR